MISYKAAKLAKSYCSCDDCINTYPDGDETGLWEVCARCGLPIEGSFILEGGDYLQSIMLEDE